MLQSVISRQVFISGTQEYEITLITRVPLAHSNKSTIINRIYLLEYGLLSISLRIESQGGQLRLNRQHITVKMKNAKKITAKIRQGIISVIMQEFRAQQSPFTTIYSTFFLLLSELNAAQTNEPIVATVESLVILQVETLNWAGQLSIVTSVQDDMQTISPKKIQLVLQFILFYYLLSNLVILNYITMQAHSNPLQEIPIVTISPSGIFKYILIACKGMQNGKETEAPGYFVRGDSKLEYHQDNFNKFITEIKKAGFDIQKRDSNGGSFEGVRGNLRLRFTCPGGGRIQHNYGGNKCFIYGYSQSYGYVDHTIAQKLISQALNYSINEIKTSQEGY